MAESNNINKEKDPRVGVYVCHCGGNISNTVDIEKVVEAAMKMRGVVLAAHNLFLCSDPGQDLIIEDIKKGKINRIVVASCAPNLHESTFRNAILRAGLNPYLYVHANIREQVSFVHDGPEATEKAIAIVAGAVSKAMEIDPLYTTKVDVRDHATVIGGGVAGLKAALDLSRRGLKVALIEKTPFLGGRTAKLDRLFPTGEKAGDVLSRLVEDILDHPDIKIYTCSEVTAQEGYIGNFNIRITRRPPESKTELEAIGKIKKLRKLGKEFEPFIGICPVEPPETIEELGLSTGAIVIATGFFPYVPKKGEYGFIGFPQVITIFDLIKILSDTKNKGKYLKVDGRKIKSIAMIHCVGSRQIPGIHEPDESGLLRENCSRACCTSLLQTAIDICSRYPKTFIFNMYRDIRTYGRGHEDIYLSASEKGVRFMRFKPEAPPQVGVCNSQEFALSVKIMDTLFGHEEVEVPVDLVVLGTGMQPGDISSLIDIMKIHTGGDGFLLEVHPKLRPVEVFTAGIYLAGTCQAPMDITEATSAASAAASKASIVLSRGQVQLEPFVATVDTTKCALCLTCVRTCPYGVPVVRESEAFIHPAACYGCGSCVSACPGNAISLAHFDDPQIRALIKGSIGSEPDNSKDAA